MGAEERIKFDRFVFLSTTAFHLIEKRQQESRLAPLATGPTSAMPVCVCMCRDVIVE